MDYQQMVQWVMADTLSETQKLQGVKGSTKGAPLTVTALLDKRAASANASSNAGERLVEMLLR